MSMKWFRMYSEFATDPKVQMMSEAYQRRYIMLLCLRCGNDNVTFHDDEIAFQLRVTGEEWAATKAVFVEKGLIDHDNQPLAWDKRQYVSDSSTARVRAHRQRKKQQAKQACNVTVTPPDTDTDTEYNSLSARDASRSVDAPPGFREPESDQPPAALPPDPIADARRFQMPDDWQPDPHVLKTLLRTQTSVKPEDITGDLIDKYRLHCIGAGRYENARGWCAGLIRWAINERKPARVVPMRRAVGAGYDSVCPECGQTVDDCICWSKGIGRDIF